MIDTILFLVGENGNSATIGGIGRDETSSTKHHTHLHSLATAERWKEIIIVNSLCVSGGRNTGKLHSDSGLRKLTKIAKVRRKQFRSRFTETDAVYIARVHDVATGLFRVRPRLSRGSAEEATHAARLEKAVLLGRLAKEAEELSVDIGHHICPEAVNET